MLAPMKIIRVNGENGARSLQMAPNSDALLLDNTAPIVWLAQTDGAGYMSLTPYDVSLHKTTPPVDFNDLEKRIANLEEIINEQSNRGQIKSNRKQRLRPL